MINFTKIDPQYCQSKIQDLYLIVQQFYSNKVLMNAVSKRTKNQNSLNTKVKPFRETFAESMTRTKSRSSLTNLAGSVYSTKGNMEFSSKKQSKRPPSAEKNPEKSNALTPKLKSNSMLGLSMRASHVPNLSDMNTNLLNEKQRLEDRIRMLKEQIAKQTRLYNKAEYENRRLHNMIQNTTASYNEAHRKSLLLEDAISQTNQENYNLKANIHSLNSQNSQKNQQIKGEEKIIGQLETHCKYLKTESLQCEKQRTAVKNDLIKQQRVMVSAGVTFKERQEQRAMVLLEVNRAVKEWGIK